MTTVPTATIRFIGVLVAIVLISSTLLANRAAAAYLETPWTCDSVPKYYCAVVGYDNNGSSVNVQCRFFKGAIDGGARRWQMCKTGLAAGASTTSSAVFPRPVGRRTSP